MFGSFIYQGRFPFAAFKLRALDLRQAQFLLGAEPAEAPVFRLSPKLVETPVLERLDLSFCRNLSLVPLLGICSSLKYLRLSGLTVWHAGKLTHKYKRAYTLYQEVRAQSANNAFSNDRLSARRVPFSNDQMTLEADPPNSSIFEPSDDLLTRCLLQAPVDIEVLAEHPNAFQNLRLLDLTGCPAVPERVLSALRSRYPQLKIVH
ncbi:MAG: hypothetical protein V4623_09030 [Pseudomonadota bacterium]